MSGDNASLALASQKFNIKIEQISKYEHKLGLTPLDSDRNQCKWLNLAGKDIVGFTAEQCDEASTDLAAYAVFIHRQLNKERALMKWLEARINLAIASELNSYEGYYSHEQRRAVAIVNNAYAKELEEFKINSQIKVEMLDGLTYQINQLVRVLLETKFSKRPHQSKNY